MGGRSGWVWVGVGETGKEGRGGWILEGGVTKWGKGERKGKQNKK